MLHLETHTIFWRDSSRITVQQFSISDFSYCNILFKLMHWISECLSLKKWDGKKTLLQTFQVKTRILLFIHTANLFDLMKTEFSCALILTGKFILGNIFSVTVVPHSCSIPPFTLFLQLHHFQLGWKKFIRRYFFQSAFFLGILHFFVAGKLPILELGSKKSVQSYFDLSYIFGEHNVA